jgi:hypothetical protein
MRADGSGQEAGEVAAEVEVGDGPVFGDGYVVGARLGGAGGSSYRCNPGRVGQV